MMTLQQAQLKASKEETKRLKALLKEVYLKSDASNLPSSLVHKLGMEFYRESKGVCSEC